MKLKNLYLINIAIIIYINTTNIMSENYSFLLQIRSYDNNVFSIWIELLQSIEEKASNYYSLLQGLEKEILKDVKKLKTCKQQRIKKFNDRVSGIQKDVETSVTEVSKVLSYFLKKQKNNRNYFSII